MTATETEVSMTAVMATTDFDAEETVTVVGLLKVDAPCLR